MTKTDEKQILGLPWAAIRLYGPQYGLDPLDVAAFIMKESRGDKYAVRFEPKWAYVKDAAKWALSDAISKATEETLQKMSFGLLQIMGTVARERGFTGPLPKLFEVATNLEYGCKKLRKVFDKYPKLDDAVAAYNAGSAKKLASGKYANQEYIDRWHEHRRNIAALSDKIT